MPDQTRNENVNEKEKIDIKKEVQEIQEFVSGGEGKEQGRGEISKIIGNATIEKEEKRKEAFLQKVGVKDIRDLTDEQQAEFNSFELDKEELEKMAEEQAKEMYDIYYARNRKLNRLIGDKSKGDEKGAIGREIDTFENEVKNREEEKKSLEEQIEELKALGREAKDEKSNEEPKYKEQKKIDELTERIGKLDGEISNIKNKLEEMNKFKQSCIHAMGLQKQVRSNMEAGLRGIYGSEIANKVISKNSKNNPSIDNKANEEKEKNQKDNQQAGPQMGGYGAAAAPMGAGFAPQQAAQNGQVAEQTTQGVPSTSQVALDNLKWLGYDGSKLNPRSARALLKNFVDNPDKQMNILKDENGADIICNAMREAGNTKNPIAALRFNKTKKQLLKLGDDGLKMKAVEQFEAMNGKPYYRTLPGNEYNEILGLYDKSLKELEEEVQKNGPSPELSQRFEELEKKYSPIVGVLRFSDSANKNLVKNKVKLSDRIKGLFTKDNKMLNESQEKKRNPKEQEMHEKAVELQMEKYANLSREELANLNTQGLNPLQQEALEKIIAQKQNEWFGKGEKQVEEVEEPKVEEEIETSKTGLSQDIKKLGFWGAVKKGIEEDKNANKKPKSNPPENKFGEELKENTVPKDSIRDSDVKKTTIEEAYSKRLDKMSPDELENEFNNMEDPEVKKEIARKLLDKQRKAEDYDRK